MLTLCIGFVGSRFQKKYCQIHHAIIFAILEAIFKNKMADFFKVIRVIFENIETDNRHFGGSRVDELEEMQWSVV